MAIFKPFRVQIVDSTAPDANVLHDLGECVIPILEWKANAPTGIKRYQRGFLADYTDDYMLAGGVNLSGDPNNEYVIESMNKLLDIAPLATGREVYGNFVAGNYIRLISESGYYATQERSGTDTINREYDPQGNLVAGTSLLSGIFFEARTDASCTCFTAVTSNGLIQSVKQELWLTGQEADRSTYRCGIYTKNADDSNNLASWLNQCTTQKEDKPQTITVSWARPGDGKVLTDTYDIDVAPPSAATGGETGGETGGGTEEGGGGGGHAF